MQIHSPEADQSMNRRRSDYIYNYFALGIVSESDSFNFMLRG